MSTKKEYFLSFFLILLFLGTLSLFFVKENQALSANLPSLSSEKAFLEMVKNFIKVKSGEYRGNVKITSEIEGDLNKILEDYNLNNLLLKKTRNLKVDFNLHFNHYFNFYDNKNKFNKVELSYSLTPNIFAKEFPSLPKVDLIQHNDVLYVRVHDFKIDTQKLIFKDKDLESFVNEILKLFVNQWIKIDFKELAGDFDFSDVIDESFKEKSKEVYHDLLKNDKLIKAEKLLKFVEDAYKKNAIKIRKLPDKKINNISTYHYKLIINEEKLKNLILSYYKSYLIDINNFNDKYLGYLKEDLDNIFENLDVKTFEIWINKKDLLPHKILVVLKIKPEKKFNPNFDVKNIQMQILLNFKKFNQPIVIELPKSSKSIKDILEEIFFGKMNPLLGDNLFNNITSSFPVFPFPTSSFSTSSLQELEGLFNF